MPAGAGPVHTAALCPVPALGRTAQAGCHFGPFSVWSQMQYCSLQLHWLVGCLLEHQSYYSFPLGFELLIPFEGWSCLKENIWTLSGQFGYCPVQRAAVELRAGKGEANPLQSRICVSLKMLILHQLIFLCVWSGISQSAPGPFGMRMVLYKWKRWLSCCCIYLERMCSSFQTALRT